MPVRVLVGLLLFLYLLTATAYNLVVPVGEAPDEPAHFGFVQILLRTGQLPTIPKDSPRYSPEAEQPPLYYLLGAVWLRLLWPGDPIFPVLTPNPAFGAASPAAYLPTYPAPSTVPIHLLRLLSTLIGLLALLGIWAAARTAWPDDPAASLVALAFAALLPGFTFAAGTVTNDILAALAGAVLVLGMLYLLRTGFTWSGVIWLGLAEGLGMLAKRSLLALLPLVVLVPFLLIPQERWRRVQGAVAGGSLALLLGVWPLVANWREYGDPFATQVTLAAKADLTSPLAHIPGFWLLPPYFLGLVNSLWGVFGLRNIELPGIIYGVYYGLCGGALLGLLYQNRRAPSLDRRIALVLALTLLLIYAGVAYHNTTFWAIQGRLLLPSFAALALLLGRGLALLGREVLPRRQARWAALAVLMGGLSVLNWVALIGYLLPVYYH